MGIVRDGESAKNGSTRPPNRPDPVDLDRRQNEQRWPTGSTSATASLRRYLSDTGDWASVFKKPWKSKKWGILAEHPDLIQVAKGDLLLCQQSDVPKKLLVGIATVLGVRDGKLFIKPIEAIGVLLKPLKDGDTRIAGLEALQGGKNPDCLPDPCDRCPVPTPRGTQPAALPPQIRASAMEDLGRDHLRPNTRAAERAARERARYRRRRSSTSHSQRPPAISCAQALARPMRGLWLPH